ncbi:hypothetical protein [Actinomadura fibrosa]|uniref:Antitoxin Xre/MbcA/ParS-like toxin-binding domain-containing protein n=1 Tax=Actinomadura fibrosa TaxID=111802 RepID=A0ABW2XCL4_9ACTN|nr:hypothetical protein [Actinomadura fibrosa]
MEEDAIVSLHTQLGRLRDPLGPVSGKLAELLADLSGGERPEAAWRRLRRLLLESLPPADAVTGLFVSASGTRSAGVAEEVDWPRVRAAARRLLATVDERGPSTEEIIELGAARLRAAPARAGFIADPDLIVLGFPDGVPRAPEFQFGPDGALRPVVRTVNRMLGAARSPWTAASWWLSVRPAAGGVPAELLGAVTDDRLVELARAVLVEV